jgi:hypothetical protein
MVQRRKGATAQWFDWENGRMGDRSEANIPQIIKSRLKE